MLLTTVVHKPNQGTPPQRAVIVAAVFFGYFLDKQKVTKEKHLKAILKRVQDDGSQLNVRNSLIKASSSRA